MGVGGCGLVVVLVQCVTTQFSLYLQCALQRARIEREMMIEEQDQRYRVSLEADRMKEEMRVEAERQMLQKQEDKIVSVVQVQLCTIEICWH